MSVNKIISNLKLYCSTLQEQNLYYCSVYKKYSSPSHGGYVRALGKSITSFRNHLQAEEPIRKVEEWLTYLDKEITRLKEIPPSPMVEVEEYESYIDKLNDIKENVQDILGGN